MLLSEYIQNDLRAEVHEESFLDWPKRFRVKLYVANRLFKEEPFSNRELAEDYAEDFTLGAYGSDTKMFLVE